MEKPHTEFPEVSLPLDVSSFCLLMAEKIKIWHYTMAYQVKLTLMTLTFHMDAWFES